MFVTAQTQEYVDLSREIGDAMGSLGLDVREVDGVLTVDGARVSLNLVARAHPTPADLRQLVEEGRFQADLFYRLHVVPVAVPPLRERRGDIPLLAEHFVVKHAARSGKAIQPLAPEVMEVLSAHDWPGNIRELEHTIERAVVLATGSTISREAVSAPSPAKVPDFPMPFATLRQNIEWIERETIRRALEASPTKKQVARLVGISPRALSYYLAKHPSIEQHATASPWPPLA